MQKHRTKKESVSGANERGSTAKRKTGRRKSHPLSKSRNLGRETKQRYSKQTLRCIPIFSPFTMRLPVGKPKPRKSPKVSRTDCEPKRDRRRLPIQPRFFRCRICPLEISRQLLSNT